VPKYDAFGREIGEDTLEGLGGAPQEKRGEADEQPVEAQPAPETGWTENAADDPQRRELAGQLSNALQQAAATGKQPTVTVRRSGSAKGCLIAFVVLVAVFGVAIAGVVSLVSSVDTGALEEAIKAPVTAEPQPKGLEAGSLARPDELGAALATIRSEGGGKLTNLRVAPERIDATLLTSEGRLRHVQVKPGGELERFGGDSGPGFDSVGTIPFGKLRPGAVQRLARRGAEEHGIPVSTFQYAVPTEPDGQVTWVVYFTRGRYVLGDARGRFERALP
jgi:hypothetical protein